MNDKRIIRRVTIVIAMVLVICTIVSGRNEKRNRPIVETVNPIITQERWLEVPTIALQSNEKNKFYVFVVSKTEGIWENEYQVHKNVVGVERKNMETCILSGISAGSNANIVIKSSGDLSDEQVVSMSEE